MTKTVLFSINDDEAAKVEFLKKFAKSKARTKVFKWALSKAYDQFKDVKA